MSDIKSVSGTKGQNVKGRLTVSGEPRMGVIGRRILGQRPVLRLTTPPVHGRVLLVDNL